MSATAIAFIGMYRAACTVLVDASGNFVNDLLNCWVGRIGEWLVLGGVMTAYAVHLRRQACAHCALGAVPAKARGHRSRVKMPPHRNNVERLPVPTRRAHRFTRRNSGRQARFA